MKLLRPAPLALVALLALPIVPCAAQDQTESRTAVVTPSFNNRVTIDFPGGPLSALVASLNTGNNERLSLIQADGLDPVLPAFSIKSPAWIDSVIAALGRILEPQGYHLHAVGPGIAVLTRMDRSATTAFASLQVQAKLKGSNKIDDLIATIESGCQFANPDGKPSTLRFQFHPRTQLLFVAGPSHEIDVARQIVNSLPDSLF